MALAEKHRRSVVKTVSYRITSIFFDSIIAYLFTHDVLFSAGLVLFVNGYSTLVYYIHERVWTRINWGRVSIRER